MRKGGFDWSLYDEKGKFVRTIKITHPGGEVIPMHINEVKKEFDKKGAGMARITKKEINHHLKMALDEIGEIVPKYSKTYKCWYFEHPLYPVNYAGETSEEVKANYPHYLTEFIKERLKDNLSELTEKKTKGRGGYRSGAGRPIGTKKESKTRVYLPDDIADWIKSQDHIKQVRDLMKRKKIA